MRLFRSLGLTALALGLLRGVSVDAQERAQIAPEKREAERRVATSVYEGTVLRTESVSVPDEQTPHMILVVQTFAGELLRADLGPAGVVAGHSLRAGDRVKLHVLNLTLGPPRVFQVRRIELNGRPIHLNRLHSGPAWSPSQPHAPARLEELARKKQQSQQDVEKSEPAREDRSAGSFGGTLAEAMPRKGQARPDDGRWPRPYYQQPGHQYGDAPMGQDRPMMPAHAWDESNDAYEDAFFRSGGPADGFPDEERFGPGYESYSRGGPYGRFLPLDYGYRAYTASTFGLD